MNLPMIDTLSAAIDIYDYESIMKAFIDVLEDKKNEAKLVAANNASDKVLISIGNQTFEILSNGAKGYAYILHNDNFEVKIAQYRSKKEEFFPIFIRIKSERLWAVGPYKSWSMIVNLINENIGPIRANKINRLDLCCHTDKLNITLEDIETFKGTFFNDQVIRDRRKVTGINFGSRQTGKIYCRIYNKSKEIAKKRKKMWFLSIWEKAGLNTENVWNVEFELNRGFFKEYQIDSVEEVFKGIRSIWEYCTKEWLVKVNLVNSRIERCPTNEAWTSLQNAFTSFESKDLIKKSEQLRYDASALVPGAIGNITSYAARIGIEEIEKVLLKLKCDGAKYIKNTNKKNYEAVILDKKKLLV